MYKEILSWSEALIILIPLAFYSYKKNNEHIIKIVFWYLIIALILNTFAGLIWQYNSQVRSFLARYKLPLYFSRNNFIYNIHSIVRTLFFIYFFYCNGYKIRWLSFKLISGIFLFCTSLVFIFFDNFFIISSKLLALEGIILMLFCVHYFLQKLGDENLSLEFDASLVVTTGLTIYEAINFFIFLFYDILIVTAKTFATNMWYVHNITFGIFCFFIAYAFYGKSITPMKSLA